MGPVSRLWRRARRQKQLPAADRLREALAGVGYQHLHLNAEGKKAKLAAAGMRLDFGGVAVGFAVDEALAVLKQHGLTRVLVNGSGDMAIGDPPPGEAGWRIGVAPPEPDQPPSRLLRLAHCGVSTSGDAWQYLEIAGRRYSHIVDPRTGVGLTTRSSVTVIAPNGMAADGLATAVSVLGAEKGPALIERTSGAACLMVVIEAGKPQLHESSRWKEFEVSARCPRINVSVRMAIPCREKMKCLQSRLTAAAGPISSSLSGVPKPCKPWTDTLGWWSDRDRLAAGVAVRPEFPQLHPPAACPPCLRGRVPMRKQILPSASGPSRRDFIKVFSLLVAGGAVSGGLNVAGVAHAYGSDEIRIGLIGCGGRGTSAAQQALNTVKRSEIVPNGPVKLVAMADVFPDRLHPPIARSRASTAIWSTYRRLANSAAWTPTSEFSNVNLTWSSWPRRPASGRCTLRPR